VRSKHRLATIGDLTLDIVVRSPSAMAVGSDVAAQISFRTGGSAANTARSFARLGGAAVFIGAVGDDRLGGRLTASLRSDGIVVHAVRVRGSSPRLVVSIGPGGERSFLTDRGVANRLSARAIRDAWLSRADALHLPFYSLIDAPLSDASLSAASRVRDRGGVVSVDLASSAPLVAMGRRLVLGVLDRVAPDVLFANAAEVAAVFGSGPAADRRLLEASPLVVVKLGVDGCRVLSRDAVGGPIEVATRRLAATDTTGAGDAFDAGFLFTLIAGGYVLGRRASAALLRRAALAGHRSAARLLTSARPELVL
jgi:sugar/nucleoside kinase (ribokinase family)